MARRLYMVVERFKHQDAVPVYRRFRDRGRLAPEGLTYVSSWVDEKLERCYQVMEADDRRLLDEWMAAWSDLVDFEVVEVVTSREAAERIAPRL
jgi:oligoribonuclease (3'-5' exoribonuclease)